MSDIIDFKSKFEMLHNIDTNIRITLQAPYTDKAGRFFSLRLKPRLDIEPAKYSRPIKMLVVSGFEGDFRTFCRILSNSRVINKRLQWTFGEGHLVIVGNCFDRDQRSVEYLWFIYSLEEKARKNGGYVHFILGDNEMVNFNGNWRYRHPKYARGNEPLGFAATALYDANNEIWRWMQTKNVVEKIGRYLFVHGGVAHQLLDFDLPVSSLNKFIRSSYGAAGTERLKDPVLSMLIDSGQSPVRYKGYYQQELTKEEIKSVLQYYKVSAIITGHARVDRIATFYDGRVINVATEHQDGSSEALLIVGQRFYRVGVTGKRERMRVM